LENERERLAAFLKEVRVLLERLEKAEENSAGEILARIRAGAREMGLAELSRAAEAAQNALKTPDSRNQLRGFINEARSFTASLTKLLGYSKQSTRPLSDLIVSEKTPEVDQLAETERKVALILREAPAVDPDINGLVEAALKPKKSMPATKESGTPEAPPFPSSQGDFLGAKQILASMALAALSHATRLLPDQAQNRAEQSLSLIRSLLSEWPRAETTPLATEADGLKVWVERLSEGLGCRINVETETEGACGEPVCRFLVGCAKNLLLAGLPLRGRPKPEDATLRVVLKQGEKILLQLEGLASMRRAMVALIAAELRHLLTALSGDVERTGESVRLWLPEDVTPIRGGLIRCGGVVCVVPLPAPPNVKPAESGEEALMLASTPETAKLLTLQLGERSFRMVVDEYLGERTLLARPIGRLCLDPLDRRVLPLVNPFALEEDDWL